MSSWLSTLPDFRFAIRQLIKGPGFTLTALLSIALGIGATTAVFSVVYGVLIDPYPYKNPERLVHLILKDKAGHDRWPGLTGPQIEQVRMAPGVESVTGQIDWSLTTTGEDLPDDVMGVYLTPNAFQHFGVPALLGREFGPADAPSGRDPEPVVVLGYKFWQRHFGGDRNVAGRNLELVHKSYVVIGVMPPRFTWGPDDGADVYLPLKLTSDTNAAYFPSIRLKPGVSRDGPRSERFLRAARGQDALAAPRCGHAAAADRMRQRVDPAAGARDGAEPRVCSARRDWRRKTTAGFAAAN
jgi:hypothetical protein